MVVSHTSNNVVFNILIIWIFLRSENFWATVILPCHLNYDENESHWDRVNSIRMEFSKGWALCILLSKWTFSFSHFLNLEIRLKLDCRFKVLLGFLTQQLHLLSFVFFFSKIGWVFHSSFPSMRMQFNWTVFGLHSVTVSFLCCLVPHQYAKNLNKSWLLQHTRCKNLTNMEWAVSNGDTLSKRAILKSSCEEDIFCFEFEEKK